MLQVDQSILGPAGSAVQVTRYRPFADEPHRGRWLAIGMFDGVHLGHQTVLAAARKAASERGLATAAIVFDPHPRSVLAGGDGPGRIHTSMQRARCLTQVGVQEVYEFHFDEDLSRLPARDFCQTLAEHLACRGITVGEGFRFGHRQGGTVATMAEFGLEMGFSVVAVGNRLQGEDPVSSTRIRRLLADGELEDANRLLGRPYQLTGQVLDGVRGEKLPLVSFGQTCLLPEGRYAASVLFEGQRPRSAVVLVEPGQNEALVLTGTTSPSPAANSPAVIDLLCAVQQGLSVVA